MDLSAETVRQGHVTVAAIMDGYGTTSGFAGLDVNFSCEAFYESVISTAGILNAGSPNSDRSVIRFLVKVKKLKAYSHGCDWTEPNMFRTANCQLSSVRWYEQALISKTNTRHHINVQSRSQRGGGGEGPHHLVKIALQLMANVAIFPSRTEVTEPRHSILHVA